MKLKTESRAKERVLLYGPMGAGKTTAALSWAEATEGTCWYVDSDNTLDRMLEGRELDNLEAFRIYPSPFDDDQSVLQGAMEALKQVWQNAKPDDLCVIDVIGPLWSDAEADYVSEVYGSDLTDFFIKARKADRAGLDGNKDWGVINKMYAPIRRFMQNPPCHMLMVAAANPMDGREKDKATLDLYGRLGWKPKGQKDAGHDAQTVIFMSSVGGGAGHEPTKYEAVALKDREREIGKFEVKDFARDYLMRRAGWKPAAGPKGGDTNDD